ncbi:site-specific integrase [Crocinitomix sp.]|nr:site-specific integrase [Crocinitomix sp.]
MAKIRFRLNKGLIEEELKESKDKGQSTGLHPEKEYPIYIRYRSGSVDFSASIDFGIVSRNWDFEKGKAIEKVSVLNHAEINSLITNLSKHFNDWELDNKRKGYKPSYNDVRKHYRSYYIQSIDEPKEMELFDLIELFIEQSQLLKRKKVSHGTVKTYSTTKEVLIDFQKYWGKLTFDKIDLVFYFDFVEWCERKRKFSLNYIGKNIKVLKTFMSYAIENGLTNNGAFKSREFKKLSEDADNIYLTQEELQSIWKLDLSKDERKERARDLFLIGAYSGLRISDFNNLKTQNIKTVKGVEMIKVPMTKYPDKTVAVPLHPIVKAILQKRNGIPPQRLPEQAINVLIKEIAESAGIDSIEYITLTKAGKKQIIRKYKFELVKSHSARRSFCSNAYLAEMSPIDIMSISGHKTEKEFLNYLKLTDEDIAIKMSTNAFFTDATGLKAI